MGERTRGADSEVPVVCSLCGTRMYTSLENVGKTIACPDCQTVNRIKRPPEKPPPAKPKYTGDEYKLQSEPREFDASKLPPHVKVTCRLCNTVVQVRIEHVGKRIKCPDCGTPNVIPPPPVEVRPFRMPDAADVALDEPPPPVDEKRKEVADRLIANATDEIRRREDEEPESGSPEETNPLGFAFRLKIIPIWLGLAIAIFVLWTMVDAITSLASNLSYESILAVFLVIITALSAVAVAGIFIPHLFTIAVFTADGHDRIPYWPSHDMLERGRAILFAVNGVTLGAAPGMTVALALHPLGFPSWLGLPFTLIFMPIIMLSMMEADSPFTPFSSRIKHSLTKHRSSWSSFYVQTVGMAAILSFTSALAWLAHPLAGQVVVVVGFSIYVVIYSHSLGRLAWVLGDPEQEPGDQPTAEAAAEVE